MLLAVLWEHVQNTLFLLSLHNRGDVLNADDVHFNRLLVLACVCTLTAWISEWTQRPRVATFLQPLDTIAVFTVQGCSGLPPILAFAALQEARGIDCSFLGIIRLDILSAILVLPLR